MEELEKRFEALLIKNKSADLIDAYTDLKKEIYRAFQMANEAIELLEKRIKQP
ncbi:MAG: hypothetical protein GY928_22250 [Colwellia sp.]|nr:hypothetical protein [Colwellia sp.]